MSNKILPEFLNKLSEQFPNRYTNDRDMLMYNLKVIHWQRTKRFPSAKFREIFKEIKFKDDK